MFATLSEKIDKVLKKLKGQGVLTEENVAEALKEVRLALLEADVNFKIVKDFIARIQEKAVGHEVLQSLSPGHQVVKIVWEELRDLMGHEQVGLALSSHPPTVIMMVGLQGSGKTTTCGKLAKIFKDQGKRVLLIAADPRRPAAGEQLAALAADLEVTVHRADQVHATNKDVVALCAEGVTRGREHGYDIVVLDTGGRLHIDDELMVELEEIKTATQPQEVLLIADAMTGQEAVSVAEQFNQRVNLTGVILTKVEGDARGGAVLSIRAATGTPIKYLGIGEKSDALEAIGRDPQKAAFHAIGSRRRAGRGLDTHRPAPVGKDCQISGQGFQGIDHLPRRSRSREQVVEVVRGIAAGRQAQEERRDEEGPFKHGLDHTSGPTGLQDPRPGSARGPAEKSTCIRPCLQAVGCVPLPAP